MKVRLSPEQITTLATALDISASWWESARQVAEMAGSPVLAEFCGEKIADIDEMRGVAVLVERITVRLRDDEHFDDPRGF